jgi:hypothetical protein
MKWSPSGNELLVSLLDQSRVVGFEPEAVSDELETLHQIDETDNNGLLIDWIGIGDLLLVSQTLPMSDEVVYSLGYIRSNEVETREAFRISVPISSPQIGIGIGNWILTADEQERGALSCLFDETLPARLEVGARARVTFTDGTPSRLRAEPGLDGAEIAQMAEGTEFSVIGGPWCADNYRWWQLELDDGAIGWSAEGDAEDYFLEPVE